MIHQNRLLAVVSGIAPYRKTWLILVLVILAGSTWVLTEPLAQYPLYHNFADQRTMFGIPHAFNVISNVVFCLAGTWGCILIARPGTALTRIDRGYLIFFIGVFCIGFGSAYYHWSPDNNSLFWDRLPMTVGFMAFTSVVVSERYDESLGYKLLPWLLILGVFSVIYWHWQNDLRPYLAVQFGPMLVLPYIIWKYSGPGTRWLWLTVVCYFAAKILELLDVEMFELTAGLVSGHTLKHLAAAAGAFMIVAKINERPLP